MKNILFISLLSLTALAASAQTNSVATNSVSTLSLTNAASSGKEAGGIEITLGGGGVTNPKNGKSEVAVDFSISTNPFEKVADLWLGVAQSVAWEPSFYGSTDVYADWNWHVWNQTIYLNTGWSVGSVYDRDTALWRTGPEVSLQYYTSDNAFIYVGVNYDIQKKDDAVRFSWGLGLSF